MAPLNIIKTTVCGCLLLLLVSCAGGSRLRYDKLSQALSKQEFIPTVETIKSNPKYYGENNRFLYNMDIGVLYHYAGLYDSSNVFLERAVKIYDDLFTRSISNEAAAILVNDNVRPYRSRPYELVLLHQFMALNYLSLGNLDAALVETRRTQLLFNQWATHKDKVEKYTDDPMFHYLSSLMYKAAGETSNSLISLFKSVEAFNNGPISLPPQIRNYAYYEFLNNDRKSDIDVLKLHADTLIDSFSTLMKSSGDGEIVVVGYAGKGPVFQESTWWGTYIHGGLLILHYTGADGVEQTFTMQAPPLPEKELKKAAKGEVNKIGTTFHVKLSMPAVKSTPARTDHFTVAGDSFMVKSYEVNDLDAMSQKYFDDNRTTILLRTVIRVVLRTITAEKAKEKLETENPLANILINVGTDILADQLEHADVRSCFLIPKTIHMARISVPAGTHTIEVAARDKDGNIIGSKQLSNIKVEPGKKQFVVYPSFN